MLSSLRVYFQCGVFLSCLFHSFQLYLFFFLQCTSGWLKKLVTFCAQVQILQCQSKQFLQWRTSHDGIYGDNVANTYFGWTSHCNVKRPAHITLFISWCKKRQHEDLLFLSPFAPPCQIATCTAKYSSRLSFTPLKDTCDVTRQELRLCGWTKSSQCVTPGV